MNKMWVGGIYGMVLEWTGRCTYVCTMRSARALNRGCSMGWEMDQSRDGGLFDMSFSIFIMEVLDQKLS